MGQLSLEEILARLGDGEQEEEAFDELFRALYRELKGLARRVRRDKAGPTFNTTALVHEVYMRMAPGGLRHQDQRHFMRAAAKAMRHCLVDQMRRRSAAKRDGGVRVTLQGLPGTPDRFEADLIDLDRALEHLEELDPRKAQIVECRFFAGLSVEETADVLGISTPTVKRDWRGARAFLADALGTDTHPG